MKRKRKIDWTPADHDAMNRAAVLLALVGVARRRAIESPEDESARMSGLASKRWAAERKRRGLSDCAQNTKTK